MVKVREFKEHNYRGVWYKGKTIRIALDPSKPITELAFPEFYDVKLTGYCEGECPWCYMDSKKTDLHYKNVIQKVTDYFEPMSVNERPFQVAIGGGEPTTHPDFVKILEIFKALGIEPNYTTNGMFASKEIASEIIMATEKYCGGVAVSCHPHLLKHWAEATNLYAAKDIKLNFHLIISDKDSIDYFRDIFDNYFDAVDYFVLLPYGNQGRAEHKEIDWEYLLTKLPEKHDQIAFGANFYPYLLAGGHRIKVSLYEPEIMSKYLDLEDMKLYNSSFNLVE